MVSTPFCIQRNIDSIICSIELVQQNASWDLCCTLWIIADVIADIADVIADAPYLVKSLINVNVP